MKSKVAHVYLYVSDLDNSYKFYKKLLEKLDYIQTVKEEWGFAFRNDGTSIWFEQARKGHVEKGYHRKRIGLNHLAFRIDSKEDVDAFYNEFLMPNKIPTLYDTPKPFSEYEEGYYAVFFEDPDRIKLEVVYYP